MKDSHCTACDWANDHLSRLLRSEFRLKRLPRERHTPSYSERMLREYDSKTEQLRRYVRGEHDRKEVA